MKSKERRFGTRLDKKISKEEESFYSLKEKNEGFLSRNIRNEIQNYQTNQPKPPFKRKSSNKNLENISEKRFKLSDIPANLDIRKMDFSTILGKKLRESPFKKNKSLISIENENLKENYNTENTNGITSMKTEGIDEDKRGRGKMRNSILRSKQKKKKMGSSNKKSSKKIPKSFSYASLKRSESKKKKEEIIEKPRKSSKKTINRRSTKGSRVSLYSRNNSKENLEHSPHSMMNNLKSQLQSQKNKFNQLKTQFNLQKSENQKLQKLNEISKRKEEETRSENTSLKNYIEKLECEAENLKSRMNFFEQIEKEIGGQPDLKEFIECNLGINKKLDLKLRKGNENFTKMCRQVEDLKKSKKRLKKEIENLNSKLLIYEGREKIKDVKQTGKNIVTVKEKLAVERRRSRKLKKSLSRNKKKEELKNICPKCIEEEEKLKQKRKPTLNNGNLKNPNPSSVEFDNLKRRFKEKEKEIKDLNNKFLLLNNELSRLNIENNSLKAKNRRLRKKGKLFGSISENKDILTMNNMTVTAEENQFEELINENNIQEELSEVEKMKENIDYSQLTILYNKLVRKHYKLIKKIKLKKEGKEVEKIKIEDEDMLYSPFKLEDEKTKESGIKYYDSGTSEEDDQDFIFTFPVEGEKADDSLIKIE